MHFSDCILYTHMNTAFKDSSQLLRNTVVIHHEAYCTHLRKKDHNPWHFIGHNACRIFGFLQPPIPLLVLRRMYRNLTATSTYVFINWLPPILHYLKWWNLLTVSNIYSDWLQIYSDCFLHSAFLLDMSFTIFFPLKWHEQQNKDNEQKPSLATDLQYNSFVLILLLASAAIM